jgi:hypothetical protein
MASFFIYKVFDNTTYDVLEFYLDLDSALEAARLYEEKKKKRTARVAVYPVEPLTGDSYDSSHYMKITPLDGDGHSYLVSINKAKACKHIVRDLSKASFPAVEDWPADDFGIITAHSGMYALVDWEYRDDKQSAFALFVDLTDTPIAYSDRTSLEISVFGVYYRKEGNRWVEGDSIPTPNVLISRDYGHTYIWPEVWDGLLR